MKILIWNKKEHRPATPEEIKILTNKDDEQLFFSWYNNPNSKQAGIVEINLDSGYGSNFIIRAIK